MNSNPYRSLYLCRCGQRWVKLNKAIGREIPARDQRGKASGPRSTSTARSATLGSPKKARLGGEIGKPIVTRIVAHAGYHRPLRTRLCSENTDTDCSDLDAGSPFFSNGNGGHVLNHGLQKGEGNHRGSSGYCIQKLTCGKATYALFWVIDGNGICQLVVVVSFHSDTMILL